MTVTTDSTIETVRLRKVFAAYPSGVTAVAAMVGDDPRGLAASSFTSVSLEPALASVCVAHTSSTWPLLRDRPHLGVSVLAVDQQREGRALSARAPDRFRDIVWRSSPQGAVFVEGASAWLETCIDNVIRAGDHDIVVLRVLDLGVADRSEPLVFHGSTFRRLTAP
ncbi:flavin reductase family protein [Flexivirga meconopsidis]|uniref:flavin reductase family protein n=1 Tax=Flexivirga meconopsidis TaxID=2977121 RepID=UPI002240AD17|nr:flavin reductase family protein [Flexivirga meconopsidis]